ncbi:phosphoribosylamine--glycine ligase [candidate division WOR-3 bacterium 4484_100]|uniref:Phosphoribosylamine--glycine ligase n=1 Tax=candidate division WOR-3 bacterium 4484_100 TaxID=1936077 RepID=A0A1V4QEF4_UNCW3|nr:MAG: phosphoribosylamine--glycine ligase [candidate division WOR-3 bacterium 4484_100]
MKVLIVGGGGREHALAWKLHRAKKVKQIYAAPGNPGIAQIGTCVNILASDIPGLARFAEEKKIDLTVVGPELPLAMGIVDEFQKRGLKIFGPDKKASRIEADKSFAREFMNKFGIPAPKFQVYETAHEARRYTKTINKFPVVVKASGLAGGKGTFIVNNRKEYEKVVDELLVQHRLGEAGKRIVVEEFLVGQEMSVFVLTDGLSIVYLPSAQDHKRLYDRNRGPNTGGMGAYAPYPTNKRITNIIEQVIIQPTILSLRDQGIDYQGVLYAGLIITSLGPMVLEFNCRFGDPETQVILPLIEGDFFTPLLAVAEKRLSEINLKVKNLWSICVVLASAGYPFDYHIGEEIQFKQKLDSKTLLFHAGTKMEDSHLVTASGRVLNVVTVYENLKIAKQRAYEEIKKIHFNGMYYRKDIGNTGMKKMKRKRRR